MRFNRTILSVLALASGMLVAAQVANADEVLLGGAFDPSVPDARLYEIDTATGALTPFPETMGMGGRGEGLAYDRTSGTLFACSDSPHNEIFTIDLSTGVGSLVGIQPGRIQGLAFDALGTLFGVDRTAGVNGSLVTIDLSTGDTTLVGSGLGVAGGSSVEGLACDPETGTLFASATVHRQLISIDPSTGVGTVVGSLDYDYCGLAFDSLGTLWGSVGGGGLFTLDPTSGAATYVGDSGVTVSGLSFVPEPGTLALLVVGAGMALRARRRIAAV